MGALELESPGALTLIQDLGRPGLAMWGVARSGAADRSALRLANRLVGNSAETAGLECLMGGQAMRSDSPATVAVTGGRCVISVGGLHRGQDMAFRLESGQRLEIGTVTAGLRVYVAVRGGLDVPEVIGSRSYDTLGDIGPAPLEPGAIVPIRPAAGCAAAWYDQVPASAPTGTASVRVVLGPRDDWFDGDSVSALFEHAWQVSGVCDRVGLRLLGPRLTRRVGDLPSEPVLPGAIQVPADGNPIVLGPDAGTTGGYPVIGVVRDDDLDRLGQLRPGDTVNFRH